MNIFCSINHLHIKSNQPINETYGNDMFGLGKITELPRIMRLLIRNEIFLIKKLNMSMSAKYTGKAKRVDRDSRCRVDEDDSLSRKNVNLNIPTVL